MSESKSRWDARWIQSILPHRYPLLLVDRVLEIEPGRRLVAIKNVTMNEQILQGHFPGRPVVPGVMLVEGMAQAGAILVLHGMEHEERARKLLYFSSIERARFRRPVEPGDQLRYEVEMLRARRTAFKLKGQVFVGDALAAEAVCMSSMGDR